MTDTTMTSQRPVLLMAGGTGGHIFPALAIAEALRAQGIPVSWLGTRRGLEAQVVPAAGIEIHYISITGLRGKGIVHLLTAPFKIAIALWQSLRVLRGVRPAAVVGMGGFVTGPGGLATWLLRIPLLIHEQNAVAGLTNRWLARLATQVLEAFPNTFPAARQALHTGNPLRASILGLPSQTTLHHPWHILVIGGSLGAQVLNEVVPKALPQVSGKLEVWHQTGEAHIVSMQSAYGSFPAKIEAFIEDMAAAYQWADLVICRAGALTISELAQCGVASILVPYPYACDDHQTHNAEFLVKNGAAILLPQTELTVSKLVFIMNELLQHPSRLQEMSRAARRCATPGALQKVLDLCLKLTYQPRSLIAHEQP